MDQSSPFLRILYGVEGKYVEVTDLALKYFSRLAPSLTNSDRYCSNLTIPANDWIRAAFFGDPASGVLKHIVLNFNGKVQKVSHREILDLNIIDLDYEPVITNPNKKKVVFSEFFHTFEVSARLSIIHSQLFFSGGTLQDEIPEQIMAITYIKPHNKVLELGANFGRNTLVISSLLEDDRNLVTLECDQQTCQVLQKNKEANRMNFFIEPSALSARRLCQKLWDTRVLDETEKIPDDHVEVSTITFKDLMAKYNIDFDTLVVDCEGALYYIFLDFPEILSGISTIIMENDYHQIEHKNFIDAFMISCGFSRDYVKGGGWGPCAGNFFEVWLNSASRSGQ